MKKIVVSFDENGMVKTETGECNLAEILLASKTLEIGVMSQIQMQWFKDVARNILYPTIEKIEKEKLNQQCQGK